MFITKHLAKETTTIVDEFHLFNHSIISILQPLLLIIIITKVLVIIIAILLLVLLGVMLGQGWSQDDVGTSRDDRRDYEYCTWMYMNVVLTDWILLGSNILKFAEMYSDYNGYFLMYSRDSELGMCEDCNNTFTASCISPRLAKYTPPALSTLPVARLNKLIYRAFLNLISEKRNIDPCNDQFLTN